MIIYFENIQFFHTQLGLGVCLDMKPLHISLNIVLIKFRQTLLLAR